VERIAFVVVSYLAVTVLLSSHVVLGMMFGSLLL
jgi:hypothetical protein